MTEDSKRGEWSLVVVAISPVIWGVSEDVERIIGRRGLDLFGLTFQPDKHIPAEICDGLSQKEAMRLASELSPNGGTFEARKTSELTGLQHRASEVWATRCTDTYCFTELGDIITVLGAINARDNLEHIKQATPDWSNWQIERCMNHMHLDGGKSYEEYVENGEKALAELIHVLNQAYPGHAFTVSHALASTVSFWQTTSDSPRDGCIPYGEYDPEKAWCPNCRRLSHYEHIAYIDRRFPKAEWGKCSVCGAQILVRACERLTFIN